MRKYTVHVLDLAYNIHEKYTVSAVENATFEDIERAIDALFCEICYCDAWKVCGFTPV